MIKHRPVAIASDEIIVVGTGMAGLITALSLAPRPVTLITKTPRLESGSSQWAKGGIAAAIGPEDSPEAHAEDTLSAGAGIGDPRRVLELTRDAAESLKLLIDEGVPFDRAMDGTLELAREAAHGRARVVHAGGDATGRVAMSALIERARKTPSIQILRNTFAHELLVHEGSVRGVLTFKPDRGWTSHYAGQVVMATGGIGMAWWHTTNPSESTGDGLAMAARAGADLKDLEFMQFHPTALAVDAQNGGSSLPLLTEALRGAGALLVDETGERFMPDAHADAEMAPRDVVARAIEGRISAGHDVFLDVRPVVQAGRASEFPEAMNACKEAGLDPARELLPVVPAAHYHMGGIHVDDNGRTSLGGLWACGEVANTGVHGANRLASNSLLEAVVYARRVAGSIREHHPETNEFLEPSVEAPRIPASDAGYKLDGIRAVARETMSRCVGIVRSRDSLQQALAALGTLEHRIEGLCSKGHRRESPGFDLVMSWGEARNQLLVSRLVTLAALDREESRGAHYREDYPEPAPGWQRRQSMTFA